MPRELLQRLPAWTVFIPTPWLRSSVGVFVTPIHDEVMVDDFILLFVIDNHDTVFVVFFRCSEPTVSASMESQFRDVASRGPAALDANAAESERPAVELFGQPYRQTIEEVMALVLYLCSEEPDIVPSGGRPPARAHRPRPPPHPPMWWRSATGSAQHFEAEVCTPRPNPMADTTYDLYRTSVPLTGTPTGTGHGPTPPPAPLDSDGSPRFSSTPTSTPPSRLPGRCARPVGRRKGKF